MRAIVVNPSVLAPVGTLFAACPACGVVQRFIYGRNNECSVCHAPFVYDGEELHVVVQKDSAMLESINEMEKEEAELGL